MAMYKKRKASISISPLGIVYVITMTIVQLQQAGIFSFYYLTSILILVFWSVFGALSFLLSRNHMRLKSITDICFVGRTLLLPWIVFIGYNCYLYLFNIANPEFMKSSFVQIMFTPCILLGALGSYYIFGNRTLRYLLYCIALQYLIALPFDFVRMGPAEFIKGTFSIFGGNSIGNPFERNSDLVLALGLLVIYYFDGKNKKEFKFPNHGWLILFLTILGGKRIQWVALIAVCGASIVCSILSEKKRNRMQWLISLGMAIGLYLFVYLEVSGILSAFVYEHGINTMGRIKMWDYIAQFVTFGPQFLGKGYAFSNLLLEANMVHTYQGHAYVLHSDILKIYFDLGFLIFSFWIIYNLFIMPKLYRRRYGYKVGNFVWYLSVLLFILYATDNAINYSITQTVLVYVILQNIFDGKIVKNDRIARVN